MAAIEDRKLVKFIAFLEQHQAQFRKRGNKLKEQWWIWFWVIWAAATLTPIVHLRYIPSDAHPAVVATLYTVVNITLVFAMLIITDDFHIYWSKYESYERVYLFEVAKLKVHLKEKTQPNFTIVLGECKSQILQVVDEDNKNYFASKFLKWTNKLGLAKR